MKVLVINPAHKTEASVYASYAGIVEPKSLSRTRLALCDKWKQCNCKARWHLAQSSPIRSLRYFDGKEHEYAVLAERK